MAASVTLRSGTWDCTPRPGPYGATLVFQHRTRHRDELRGWSEARNPDEEELRAVALQPAYRVWEDGIGLMWRVSLHLSGAAETGGYWLVFERGTVQRRVLVASQTLLGDLPHQKLLAALEAAVE